MGLPLHDYTLSSLGVTVLTLIIFIIVSILSATTLHKLRDIAQHLLMRFRVLTILSIITHIATCFLFWISMIFYQAYPVTSSRSTFIVCAGLFVYAVGKSCMYCLFLDRLYTTFNRSAYRVNKKLVTFVVILIGINFVNYICIVYFYYEYRRDEDNITTFYLATISFFIEIVYSTIIVQQFAKKLYKV